MSMIIAPAEQATVTKICCPSCGERVKGIGLLRSSKIEGLTFRCKSCKGLWIVKTE